MIENKLIEKVLSAHIYRFGEKTHFVIKLCKWMNSLNVYQGKAIGRFNSVHGWFCVVTMLVKQKVHCYIPFDAELNFQSNGVIGFSVV